MLVLGICEFKRVCGLLHQSVKLDESLVCLNMDVMDERLYIYI